MSDSFLDNEEDLLGLGLKPDEIGDPAEDEVPFDDDY